MKAYFAILILLLSLNVTPNDKGNGLSDVVLFAQSKSLEELLTHGSALTSETYAKLARKSAHRSAGKIAIPLLADFVPVAPSFSFPDSLVHSSGSAAQASRDAQRFIWVLVELLRFGDDELMHDLITRNPDFYEAYSFGALREQIRGLSHSASERDVALLKLSRIESGFWLMVRGYVTASLGEGAWLKFRSMLEADALGYRP